MSFFAHSLLFALMFSALIAGSVQAQTKDEIPQSIFSGLVRAATAETLAGELSERDPPSSATAPQLLIVQERLLEAYFRAPDGPSDLKSAYLEALLVIDPANQLYLFLESSERQDLTDGVAVEVDHQNSEVAVVVNDSQAPQLVLDALGEADGKSLVDFVLSDRFQFTPDPQLNAEMINVILGYVRPLPASDEVVPENRTVS